MRALSLLLLLVACSGTTTDTTPTTDTDTSGTGLVDNGDGTATASDGLVWEVDGSADGLRWAEAVTYCEELTLAGGGWHLPSLTELRTLIRGCEGTVTDGECPASDTCDDLSCRAASCYACAADAGPTDGCYGPAELPNTCEAYWSSLEVSDDAGSAWFVSFVDGHVYSYGVGNSYYARCVRS
ncbi:MAG: DUF1566 domain-containing protein [Alphaproteobacteria bacterium]|nr:DUF1566 domain-containing protein [Alphaproteobacteria bacterium]MCB9698642.1 DUF1566 domain-containing protein [Alphaproteobacteria bacterium]